MSASFWLSIKQLCSASTNTLFLLSSASKLLRLRRSQRTWVIFQLKAIRGVRQQDVSKSGTTVILVSYLTNQAQVGGKRLLG